MTQLDTVAQPSHAQILDDARRANVAIDETHFAVAYSQEASIGVAPLKTAVDALNDLRGGKTVLFITLSPPAGVHKTNEGVAIAEGAYLVSLAVDEAGKQATGRLLTAAGLEIGMVPVEMTPTHAPHDRWAVSGHVGNCGVAADCSGTVFGHAFNITVVISWC